MTISKNNDKNIQAMQPRESVKLEVEEKFNEDNGSDLFWVGIGASAGGLEALREFVAKIPRKQTQNITYIVAQHLSPKHQSMLVQLVSRETQLRVQELEEDGTIPEPNVMYIIPPNNDVFVKDKMLFMREPLSEFGPKPSVDFFFTTLAEELGSKAVGIILSGTGSDGSHGVRAIRASGGITFVQDPQEAKYDGMPQSAIDTRCIDKILPVAKMGHEIYTLISSPDRLKVLQEDEVERTTIQELLFLLRERSNVNFGDYKMATLYRRINRRMTACNTIDLEEYLAHVKQNPEELDNLFKDIMITVTSFFRDSYAFQALEENIKGIIASKSDRDEIRLWVPGCATGEEVYTMAIMFAEAVGGIANLQQKYSFQIFATDIDVDALDMARKGIYAETTLQHVEPDVRNKYFRHKENSFEVIKSIRDMVVFSRHNVFDNPPFLRMDLISCRNLLIYFNNKLQHEVLSLFHYALNHHGILFLGKSEALGQSSGLFQAIDTKNKIFKTKVVAGALANRSSKKVFSAKKIMDLSPLPPPASKTFHDLPDAFIETLSPNSLLIDENMEVIRIYGEIHDYTKLSPGSANMNLMSIARKEFRQELRALTYKVIREKMKISSISKRLDISGQETEVNIVVRPLALKHSPEKLVLVSFEKVKKVQKSVERLQSRDSDDPIIAELEQELMSTREHLQTVVEELETSNEELQSTNEEMQSTNEELQSSNEELETANEELQSTNEELLTVNEELQVKSGELFSINEDLNNVKESVGFPIIVVDEKLKITRHNKSANNVFILDDNSEGQSLTAVTTKIDIPHLRTKILEVIKSGKMSSRQLDGNEFNYLEKILPYRDEHKDIKGAVLTYVDNTAERGALIALEQSQERYDLAVKGSNAGIWDWDMDKDVIYWSPYFASMLGHDNSLESTFEEFSNIIHLEDKKDVLDILKAHLDRGFAYNVELRLRQKNGNYLWVHMRGQAFRDSSGKTKRMAGSIYDITNTRLTFEKLTESNESLERFAYVCSHDLKEPARIIGDYCGLFMDKFAGDFQDPKAQKYLNHIHENSLRMQDMIRDILEYSRMINKNLDVEPINLNVEIDRVLSSLKLAVEEKNTEIVYGDFPKIFGDRIQIAQVLQNLIANAIKFSCNLNPRVEIKIEEKDGDWIISVADNGIGIKPEHHKRIFDVFQRLHTTDEYKGTGIGLSICQKAVSKHNGKMWLESEEGQGATFYFSIPQKLKSSSRIDNQENTAWDNERIAM